MSKEAEILHIKRNHNDETVEITFIIHDENDIEKIKNGKQELEYGYKIETPQKGEEYYKINENNISITQKDFLNKLFNFNNEVYKDRVELALKLKTFLFNEKQD